MSTTNFQSNHANACIVFGYCFSHIQIYRQRQLYCCIKWLRYSESMYDKMIAYTCIIPLHYWLLVSWAWISCSSSKRQKKIVWVHYKIKRSDKNTSDSTSDIKCKDKGLLSQYLALTKDGWEGRNSARTVCWFFLQKKKSPSFFPSIYQAIKTRPCYNSERGIPPCCYTQSNVG